jgi:hypothetical protein
MSVLFTHESMMNSTGVFLHLGGREEALGVGLEGLLDSVFERLHVPLIFQKLVILTHAFIPTQLYDIHLEHILLHNYTFSKTP